MDEMQTFSSKPLPGTVDSVPVVRFTGYFPDGADGKMVSCGKSAPMQGEHARRNGVRVSITACVYAESLLEAIPKLRGRAKAIESAYIAAFVEGGK